VSPEGDGDRKMILLFLWAEITAALFQIDARRFSLKILLFANLLLRGGAPGRKKGLLNFSTETGCALLRIIAPSICAENLLFLDLLLPCRPRGRKSPLLKSGQNSRG
jgi:hypothetical protein